MLGAALEDLRRIRKIAAVLTRHGFQEVADRLLRAGSSLLSTAPRINPAEALQGAGERSRLSPQQRFCRVLEDLGPTFIKLGQVLSTRHDLLPMAYIEELSRLQDDVEPCPFDQIAGALQAGLGRPVEELFAEIDPLPMATASIAQVHSATLRDGTPVVIKVQRPGTGDMIKSDLDVLRGVARLVDATIDEARAYDPVGIVGQFEEALRLELDYQNEARNLEEFRAHFREVDWVVIPRGFGEATSRTVLTLERLSGLRLRDVPGMMATSPSEASADETGLQLRPAVTPPNRDVLIDRIIRIAYKMLFEDGLFHADPHPGNILILEGDRIGIIDFGLVGRVTGQMRETLIQLALGIVTRDVAGLARLFYRLGSEGQRIDLSRFRREIEALLDRYLGLTLSQIDTRSLIGELFEAAVRYRIRVPSSYALMVKTAATVEGVVRFLAPELNLLEVTRPYAQRLLAERYGPQELSLRAARLGMNLAGMLQELPLELEQVMMDLETGRLSIQMESETVRELGDRINALGSRVFLGLFASGVLVATVLVFTQFPFELFGRWQLPVQAGVVGLLVLLGAGVVTGLVFAAATWHLLSTRYHKLRLRNVFRVGRWIFRSHSPRGAARAGREQGELRERADDARQEPVDAP